MKLNRPLPFMDRVHGMLFTGKLGSFKLTGEHARAYARFRADLRRAEKFILDDDLVRLVCHLSHEQDRLEGWSFLARLPFDVCWMECDLHTKVREFHRMGTLAQDKTEDEALVDVSPTVGILFHRDDPGSTSPRWVAHLFYDVQGQPEPGFFSYVFDPEGSDYAPVRGSTSWRMPTLSLIPGFPAMPVDMVAIDDGETIRATADPEVIACGDMGFDADSGALICRPWAANRTAVTFNPSLPLHRIKTSAIPDVLREEVGTVRWLVALLAAINSLPRDLKQAQTLSGKRTVGANILPYFQHRVISIKAPNEGRLVWARKQMQTAVRNAPRAWHRVRGHWRIIDRGKPRSHICRHLPTMVEAGVGICEKCEMIVRWIADHERGDPTIGIADHTYRGRAGA